MSNNQKLLWYSLATLDNDYGFSRVWIFTLYFCIIFVLIICLFSLLVEWFYRR